MEGADRMPDSLEVVEGDITRLNVDAIVNAANEQLAPGGGVCGAIHRAAGPELARACARLGGCPTGAARITPGFKLPARWVIHAVGPIWRGGGAGEEALLAGCYRESLRLAAEAGCHSIALPAISTGIFGYPLVPAARVAVSTVAQASPRSGPVAKVVFCCFGGDAAAAYREALEAVRRS